VLTEQGVARAFGPYPVSCAGNAVPCSFEVRFGSLSWNANDWVITDGVIGTSVVTPRMQRLGDSFLVELVDATGALTVMSSTDHTTWTTEPGATLAIDSMSLQSGRSVVAASNSSTIVVTTQSGDGQVLVGHLDR
jgi:hypothetical protein